MVLSNTYATVKKFVHLGFSEDQAEAITEAINEQNQELATKTDIAVLRSDMSSMKAELKAEISEVSSELKLEIASIKSDIASLRSDSKWSMNIIMVLLGGLIALLAPLGIQAIMQMIKHL